MATCTLAGSARRIVIIGASGNAHDILDILDAVNMLECRWKVAGFLDDARPAGAGHFGATILGRLEEGASLADVSGPLSDTVFVNAIASERTHRQKIGIIARTGLPTLRFATLVHPFASVSPRAALGRDVCIGPHCAIAGAVRVEDHVWIGAHCLVGHDCEIAAGATLAAGANLAGGVRVGAGAYVGTGACIRPGCTIGAGALVGMGAVVLKDVPPGATVVGNPAYILRSAPNP
ncbi:NeuD/PglB/VioB family sugar acetyltransferase [Neoroseomonas soli]|uniref:Sugar O-acyltransferase n=1 Tax=Neoroseomonas soli TaxID=1081025 RepID=A0A9X9WSL0_9PROT|nr:NeuD/PglB/VioB family sugar acetyltransferase [Neoroseomonas soli]MBR0670139.1 sugar O-acyltransferase [Neoroseomonas soli]